MTKNAEKTINENLLLEIYKTRVQSNLTQGNRMWTRFNYFLVVDIGLFALFFSKDIRIEIFYGAIFGIFFSFVWLIMGIQDNYFTREHRNRVDIIEKEIIPMLHLEDKIKSLSENTQFKAFRIPKLKVTPFVIYIPFLFMLLWILILILLNIGFLKIV